MEKTLVVHLLPSSPEITPTLSPEPLPTSLPWVCMRVSVPPHVVRDSRILRVTEVLSAAAAAAACSFPAGVGYGSPALLSARPVWVNTEGAGPSHTASRVDSAQT